MTDVSNCFVLAFSRTEQGIRIEAVIKALSRRHARSAAFQMAAMNLGAMALSETGHPGLDEWGDAEILAQFGDVPDGLDLHYQIKALWNSGVLQDTSASNQPLAKATPSANSLLSRLSNIMSS
jgi:hypothetical protein